MEHTRKATFQDGNETVESATVDCSVQEVPAAPHVDMRALIELASRIARRGYGESIIELAMRRKGVSREVARLVAASVASCNAMILVSEENSRLDKQPSSSVRNIDRRAARAAGLALSKITSFIAFFIAGVGGGAVVGWGIGFNQGIDDGFNWLVRAIERLM